MSDHMIGWEIRTPDITFGRSERYGVPYASGSGIRYAPDAVPHVRRLLEHYLAQAERCRSWLMAMGEPGTPKWRAHIIINDTALRYGVLPTQVIGRDRSRWMRAAGMSLAARISRAAMSLAEIGRALGGRRHTTILALLRSGGGNRTA